MPLKKPARSPKKKPPKESRNTDSALDIQKVKLEIQKLKALRDRSGPDVSDIIGARIEVLENQLKRKEFAQNHGKEWHKACNELRKCRAATLKLDDDERQAAISEIIKAIVAGFVKRASTPAEMVWMRSEIPSMVKSHFRHESCNAYTALEIQKLKGLRKSSGPDVSDIIDARIKALENQPSGTAPTHSAPEDADRECAFLHVELCHDKILTLAEKHQSKLPGAGFHLDRVAIAFLTNPPARETLMKSPWNYEFSEQLDEAVRSRLLDALGSAAPCVISGDPGALMEPFASDPDALTSFAILQVGIGREDLREFLRDLAARWQALQLPADFNPFQDGGNDSEHLNKSFREFYLLPAVAAVGRKPEKVIEELARMSKKAHRRGFLDAPWTVPAKQTTKFEARPHLKQKTDRIRRLYSKQQTERIHKADAKNDARLRLHKRISEMIRRHCPPSNTHPKPA